MAQWLKPAPWFLAAIPLPYLAVLAVNVPARVLLACVLFVAAFLAGFLALPPVPLWSAILLVPMCHVLQNWSHRIWTRERDMTAFRAKYRKGPALFTLLSFYELPLLLNYLLFDRKNWSA